MKRSAFLALSLFLAACADAPLRPTADPEAARAARLERQIERLRRYMGVPGMAAGVVRDGRLAWSRGFGDADPKRKTPATDRTPFRLASLTKSFTSILLLQLESEEKLSLTDPVVVDTNPFQTSLWKVLSHTADTDTVHFRYDHERFKALGPIIESAAGKPLRLALEERVLLPLGMGDTAPGEDAGACAPFPDAYDEYMAARDTRVLMESAPPQRIVRGRARPAADAPSPMSSAGGLISTVRDLAKFAAALDDRRLLKEDVLSRAFTAVRTSTGAELPYGLGWFVQTVDGEKIVWHHGYVPDLSSSLFVKFPGRGLTFILLADADALSAPFADELSAGDLTASAFALDFMRIYVEGLDAAYDPDWTAWRPFHAWRRHPPEQRGPDRERRAWEALRAWRSGAPRAP